MLKKNKLSEKFARVKRSLGFILVLLLCSMRCLHSQNCDAIDTISYYIDEIKLLSEKNESIWNVSLYGPLLFVNPTSRCIYANEVDSVGSLKKNANLFIGTLPQNINIANTSLNWQGKRWAMVMLPLPESKTDRMILLTHELFHRVQPKLGFTLYNSSNNHLDKKEGRILIRLEIHAIKKALHSTSSEEMLHHLNNALVFRQYRRSIYLGSSATENELELNEGLAEYTGVMCAKEENTVDNYLSKGLDKFEANPSYVRSFAYYTIPLYGYLLNKSKKSWNQNVTDSTDLTALFLNEFNIKLMPISRKRIVKCSKEYNGALIEKEENSREKAREKQQKFLKDKFINQPHLEIKFESMNISFDPRNLFPIDNVGTVYPNIRVTDNWGVLTVENGALIVSNWDKIILSKPISITKNLITGDGWKLELNQSFKIVNTPKKQIYELSKNQK